MKRGSRAGLTLMEVLVAVTLLSLLSVGMLFAIRIALNAMQKTNHRLTSNRRVLSSQRILEQQIAGLVPVANSGSLGTPLDRPTSASGRKYRPLGSFPNEVNR